MLFFFPFFPKKKAVTFSYIHAYARVERKKNEKLLSALERKEINCLLFGISQKAFLLNEDLPLVSLFSFFLFFSFFLSLFLSFFLSFLLISFLPVLFPTSSFFLFLSFPLLLSLYVSFIRQGPAVTTKMRTKQETIIGKKQ